MADAGPVTLALYAMATRFEIVLYGDDPSRLRAAGEEALREIELLEGQLSSFRPDSEISWINARASEGPVRVEPRLFRLLRECAALARRTDGAFDITIRPLLSAWGFTGGTGRVPSPEALEEARAVTGIGHLAFDDDNLTIAFDRPGVRVDLGGYGKGYAIERATESLRENGIESALVHGGTSSISTIGSPPEGPAWRIALAAPFARAGRPLETPLGDTALSVSAVHGKSFSVDGRTYGHVVDPRTGEPARRALAAAVTGPKAATCEALSTALLVLGPSWLPRLSERFGGYGGAVALESGESGVDVVSAGLLLETA